MKVFTLTVKTDLFLVRAWETQLVNFNFVHILVRSKKVTLVSEMRMTKEIFTWAVAKNFFINLTEFFKQSLHLKNYSNNTFLSWKTKSHIFYCLKGKRRKFIRMNLLVKIFFVCVFFWSKKCIFSYTFDLCGRVDDKKFFTQPISGSKTTFFGLITLSSSIVRKMVSSFVLFT